MPYVHDPIVQASDPLDSITISKGGQLPSPPSDVSSSLAGQSSERQDQENTTRNQAQVDVFDFSDLGIDVTSTKQFAGKVMKGEYIHGEGIVWTPIGSLTRVASTPETGEPYHQAFSHGLFSVLLHI